MVIQLVVMSQVAASGVGFGIGLHWTHGTALAGTGAGDAWASNAKRAKMVAIRRVKKVVFILKSWRFWGCLVMIDIGRGLGGC